MTKTANRGASHSGFHFYNLYQLCPFKFAIRYALRLMPKFTAMPLINGLAFHEGKATFYNTRSKKRALEKCKDEIVGNRELFQFADDYETVYHRCPILLEYWIEKFGYEDLEYFKPFLVEKELRFDLGHGTNGYITLRPDTVLKSKKTGRLTAMETKTSSFSVNLTITGVNNGDQATAYWIGIMENFPKERLEHIIADVAYWNKEAKYESNISCVRSDPIVRTAHDVEVFKASVAQIFYEISTKMQALKAGYNPYALFPRNTHYCNAFFKSCEYIEVCRRPDLFKGFRHYDRFGLKKERNSKFKDFCSYTMVNDNVL